VHRGVSAIGVMILAVLGVMALGAVAESSVRGGQPAINASEQFTAQPGASYTVANNSDFFGHSETVTVRYNGSTFDAPRDYRWHPTNATLTVPSSTSIPSGVTATIEYRYHEPSQAQRAVGTVSRRGLLTVEPLVVLVGFGVLAGFMFVLAGIGGRV
jgi:hypothetical protein